MDTWIAIVISCLIIICLCSIILYNQHKLKSKYMKKYKAFDVVPLTHVYGLPLSEWLPVSCYISKTKYIFVGDNKEFVMIRKQISNKYLATDIDIKKQAVSNAKGAIAGAAVFGAIGALLADNAKVVNITTVRKLLIFEYIADDGSNKTFAFDIYNNISEKTATYKFNIKKPKEVIL